MKACAQWNSQRFALVGAIVGAAYGFGMSLLVGIASMRNIDLLVWAMIFSASFGAALCGGIAVLRNMLAFYLMQLRAPRAVTLPSRQLAERSHPRNTKNAPAAISAKPIA